MIFIYFSSISNSFTSNFVFSFDIPYHSNSVYVHVASSSQYIILSSYILSFFTFELRDNTFTTKLFNSRKYIELSDLQLSIVCLICTTLRISIHRSHACSVYNIMQYAYISFPSHYQYNILSSYILSFFPSRVTTISPLINLKSHICWAIFPFLFLEWHAGAIK